MRLLEEYMAWLWIGEVTLTELVKDRHVWSMFHSMVSGMGRNQGWDVGAENRGWF